MIHLVTGGSGSGKSGYAEWLVMESGSDHRIYVAAMRPWDEECKERILRHRTMRADKGFHTVERYRDLQGLKLEDRLSCEKRTVLLECMSNVISNEMFDTGQDQEPDRSLEDICLDVIQGVKALASQTDHMVIVTNEVFSDGIEYDRATEEYQKVLGSVNQYLGTMADRVTEVVAGIPLEIKGRSDREWKPELQ